MIPKKWPDRKQWALFFKILTRREKILFFLFAFLFVFSFLSLATEYYLENTKSLPSYGGRHIEGVVGNPRFINPIYIESDTDRDLVEIIFSGLVKYDNNLGIVLDLAKSYEVEEDEKVYRVFLRDDIFWHDGEPITADDIIFTIKTIQNPDYKSHFRPNWIGVKVEKINEKEIKFELKRPYASFLENLTFKIMPEHIWEDVPPQKFFSDTHHLKPVGSGPYKVLQSEAEMITLARNPLYYGEKPFIDEVQFVFFENEEALVRAARRGKIDGLAVSSSSLVKRLDTHKLYFPRYFALFLNPQKSELLKNVKIRKALNYGTDKKSIVNNVLGENNEEQVVDSPVLPSIYGIEEPDKTYNFDQKKAVQILEDEGFNEDEDNLRKKLIEKENSFQFKSKLDTGLKGREVEELQRCLSKLEDIYPEKEITGYFGKKTETAVINFQEKYKEEILEPWGFNEGTGIVSETTRKKLNEVCFKNSEEAIPLSFTLKTIEHPMLLEVARIIKEQWREIGVEIEIESAPKEELVRSRNYEILLLGKVLGALPDFFPFWHSSQIKDPGYNLSLYQNKEADKILEEIRENADKEKMASLQNIIIEDAPAVFLYSPDYIYATDTKGIEVKKIADPSKRFINIEDWFIKTKRTPRW